MPSFCKIVAQFDNCTSGFDFLVAIVEGNPSDAIMEAESILIDHMVEQRSCNEKEVKDFVKRIVDSLDENGTAIAENVPGGPAENDFCTLTIRIYELGDVLSVHEAQFIAGAG